MKIIHCADIHLDSPFTLSDPTQASKRRHALRSTFSNLVLYAKTKGTQLFIISGDLFDRECVTKDTTLMLCREMASLPDCKFVIAPGNHDPFNESSAYRLVDFPDNVYIFKSKQISYFEFPDLDCRIYGYAFTGDTYNEHPLQDFSLPKDGFMGVNILAAHCDFDKENSFYAPITKNELLRAGFDYAALGHIHKGHNEVQNAGECGFAYSGCLEARSFGETGPKGAFVGDISKQGVNLKFKRFCSKCYEILYADVTGCSSFYDCKDSLVEKCRAYGEDVILRIVLTGEVSCEFSLSSEVFASYVPFLASVEVRDETTVAADFSSFENQNTLAGELYRQLKPQLFSQDEKTRKTANGALKLALRALNTSEL